MSDDNIKKPKEKSITITEQELTSIDNEEVRDAVGRATDAVNRANLGRSAIHESGHSSRTINRTNDPDIEDDSDGQNDRDKGKKPSTATKSFTDD